MDSCPSFSWKYVRDFFVYTIAIVSSMSLVTLVILMDYKKCINTPLNTTYIFQDHAERS